MIAPHLLTTTMMTFIVSLAHYFDTAIEKETFLCNPI